MDALLDLNSLYFYPFFLNPNFLLFRLFFFLWIDWQDDFKVSEGRRRERMAWEKVNCVKPDRGEEEKEWIERCYPFPPDFDSAFFRKEWKRQRFLREKKIQRISILFLHFLLWFSSLFEPAFFNRIKKKTATDTSLSEALKREGQEKTSLKTSSVTRGEKTRTLRTAIPLDVSIDLWSKRIRFPLLLFLFLFCLHSCLFLVLFVFLNHASCLFQSEQKYRSWL